MVSRTLISGQGHNQGSKGDTEIAREPELSLTTVYSLLATRERYRSLVTTAIQYRPEYDLWLSVARYGGGSMGFPLLNLN